MYRDLEGFKGISKKIFFANSKTYTFFLNQKKVRHEIFCRAKKIADPNSTQISSVQLQAQLVSKFNIDTIFCNVNVSYGKGPLVYKFCV